MAITLTVNGQQREVDSDPDKPLLWVLREDLDMPGTKFGCGAGQCGACTVLIDGNAVRSCITQTKVAADREIITIENVASLPVGAKLSEAWVELDVPQCGYCQAGQIMSATALLTRNPTPSDAEIDSAMEGNICRCATYLRIRAAIKQVAAQSDGEAA